MTDVNWDLAPEGADKIGTLNGQLSWLKGDLWWDEDDSTWNRSRFSIGEWAILSTRPQPRLKTVEDVIAAYPEWPFSGADFLGFLPKAGVFFGHKDSYEHKADNESYTVCTREQYEAAKAEGEKWTHIYAGDKAYIKVGEPDCDGYMLVVTECDGYNLATQDDLKPINPTITKAQAWDMCQDYDGKEAMEVYMYRLGETYDITD